MHKELSKAVISEQANVTAPAGSGQRQTQTPAVSAGAGASTPAGTTPGASASGETWGTARD